jgi:hypothetical protein
LMSDSMTPQRKMEHRIVVGRRSALVYWERLSQPKNQRVHEK